MLLFPRRQLLVENGYVFLGVRIEFPRAGFAAEANGAAFIRQVYGLVAEFVTRDDADF